MSETNYYIPSIEEFGVGVEYESTSPYFTGIYCKEVMADLRELYWSTNSGHGMNWEAKDHYFDANGNIRNIRIKFLDQEDFESLGFTTENDSHGTKYHKDNIEVEFLFNKKLIIKRYEKEFNISFVVFMGSIKNKSELKRILNQIGYE